MSLSEIPCKASEKNRLISSSVLKILLVNFRLRECHIFSAGLSSGLYGGRNSNAMLWGMLSFFALCKAPLSSTTILNCSLLCSENWLRYD